MRKEIVYKARSGAPFPAKDATKIGRYLDAMVRRVGRPVTPDDIVEDARRPASILHHYFTWDESQAAAKWLLQEARQIVNHVIRVELVGGKNVETNGFFSVVVQNGDGVKERGYVPIQTVAESADLTEQAMEDALRVLRYWQTKYASIRALSPAARQVDKAIRALERKRQRK